MGLFWVLNGYLLVLAALDPGRRRIGRPVDRERYHGGMVACS